MQSPPLTAAAAGERPRPLALDPQLFAAVLCVGFALLWAIGLSLTHTAPEPDSLEQIVWAQSLEFGYWKHPPLPTWLMAALLRVFGASVPLTFFAAHACVAIALFLTWRLGARLVAPGANLVALALTSLVAYHNLRADTFNHNTVLLPLQAGMVLAFHRAMRSGRLWHWLAAGVVAGLAMLVKYAALLPIAALVLYVVFDRSMHNRRTLAGALLAAGACLAVTSPHLHWLVASDWLPLKYMHEAAPPARGLFGTCGELGAFLLTQLARLLPLALAAWWVLRRARPAQADVVPRGSDRLFLWVVGTGPLVMTLAYGLLTESAIPSRWATSAFLLAGWLVVDASRRDFGPADARRAVVAAIALQVVLCVGLVAGRTLGAHALGIRTSANYPLEDIARHVNDAWREHGEGPLRFVAGGTRVGAAVALHTQPAPLVLIDGRPERSPWVDMDDVADCGMVVLVDETTGTAGEAEYATLWALWRSAPVRGEWHLDWSKSTAASSDDKARARILWGVVPPQHPGLCTP